MTIKIKTYHDDIGWTYYCGKCNGKVKEADNICPGCYAEFERVETV